MENYNRKQTMDLSSFFLIEFSDDSEADLGPSIVAASVEDNNTDDAQSSCNDSCGVLGWDYSYPDHGIELYNDDGSYAFQDCTAGVVERPWEEFYEEEEEGEVNMSGRRRHNNSKASSCIHDGGSRDQQPVSEMEKNKNFWETCLASGF
uniref:Uncharacterized protein n=1 Tax=Kalanchoe fedtschenkoi TaxID=63787 RepID=A0A7N0T8U1_KALFE